MYVHMHVCINQQRNVYIYICMCIYIYTDIYIYVCICVYKLFVVCFHVFHPGDVQNQFGSDVSMYFHPPTPLLKIQGAIRTH